MSTMTFQILYNGRNGFGSITPSSGNIRHQIEVGDRIISAVDLALGTNASTITTLAQSSTVIQNDNIDRSASKLLLTVQRDIP